MIKENSVIEEVWRIKDDMAREADGDVRRLCENTRQWAIQYRRSKNAATASSQVQTAYGKEEVAPILLREDASDKTDF